MIKQTLFFSNPVSLSLRRQQIVICISNKEEVVTRPVEDLGCVVLENNQIKMTIPLLNELVKNNVSVILCDDKHLPSSMLVSLNANTTQTEHIKSQLSATEPTKKQIWKQIIEAKIKNQNAILNKYTDHADLLKPFYMNVKSGDSDNREGIAAKIYWNALLGKSFRRDRFGDNINTLLNYGYSIIRAAMARSLLGSGLLPQLGIFHKSKYNAFPLIDDIMEPYRPYIDDIVCSLCDSDMSTLNSESKAALLSVLDCDVYMGNVTRPLQIAMTFTSASLVRFYSGEAKKLNLPSITQ